MLETNLCRSVDRPQDKTSAKIQWSDEFLTDDLWRVNEGCVTCSEYDRMFAVEGKR
jgi:hypothetical protein